MDILKGFLATVEPALLRSQTLTSQNNGSKNKIINSNPLDGSAIAGFISNLAPQDRLQLLHGGLPLPFDNLTNTLITSLNSFLPL